MATSTTKLVDGKTITLTPSGYIGETSDIFNIVPSSYEKIILDLGNVNYLNSVGVKNWINWSSKIPPECAIELLRVPPSVVNQINQVVGFLPPQANVKSVMVPYYCDTCSKEESLKYDQGTHYQMGSAGQAGWVKHPEGLQCGKDDCTYSTDVLESKFFKFIEKAN